MYLPFTWRNFIRSPWSVLSRLNIVDNDVIQFVYSITQNVWLFRYHWMRRWLMLDRATDVGAVVVFVVYHSASVPHWEVCLGVYITFRLVSVSLFCGTNLCECYAVRTVLPWIISGLLCVALVVPMILHEEISTASAVCVNLLFCAMYVGFFIYGYSLLHGYQFVYDPFGTRWFNIFTNMRKSLMWLDRLMDGGAVCLFVLYHISSVPHWEVCLYVYITFRLVSFAVCCGTNLCECYFVRTVLLWAANGFCCAAFCAPGIAAWSDGLPVIYPVGTLVLFRALYLVVFIEIYRRCSQCESD